MPAISGNGTTFKWNTVEVGLVQSVSGPSASVATIETTDISGSAKTFIAGMVDGGEVSLEVSYDPDTAENHDDMTTDFAAGTAQDWVITFSDTSSIEGSGIITSFSASASIDDKVTASFTIKVSGALTFNGPSA
jgi:predicted secreted protein